MACTHCVYVCVQCDCSSQQTTAVHAERLLNSLQGSKEGEDGDDSTDGKASSGSSGKKGNPLTKRSDVFGESDAAVAAELDEEKVQAAMKRLQAEQAGGSSIDMEEVGAAVRDSKKNGGGSKRSYNSMSTVDVTAEDMEAYRRIKTKRDDPMAAFLGGGDDVLLDYDP